MKRLISAAILIGSFVVPTLAHGDADHVRGTVTSITAEAIVVKTTTAEMRTLTLDAKTVYLHGTKKALAADVKVGDRVVIDVPKKTNRAEEITFNSPAPASTTKKK